MATTEAKSQVYEFLGDSMPTVADCGDDVSKFSADVRAWMKTSAAIMEALKNKG